MLSKSVYEDVGVATVLQPIGFCHLTTHTSKYGLFWFQYEPETQDRANCETNHRASEMGSANQLMTSP